MDTLDIGKGKRTVPVLRFKEFDGEWLRIDLVSICSEITYGLTVRPNFTKTGIPLISAREIRSGTIDYVNSPKISKIDFDALSNKAKPQIGDLFLSKTGSIGFSALVDKEIVAAITQNIAIIRIKEQDKYSTKFILQYFKSKQFLKSAISRVNQSTIMDLQLRDIRKLLVPLITYPEQKKIATFLSTIDKKIQQLTRKKALLEAYKKGLMQQLFSGELRFRPARQGDGDEKGKDYPAWEEKRLGEVLTIGSGKDYKHLGKGDIPVFGTGGYMRSVDDKLHEGETVFIGRKGTINKPFYFKGPFWTVDTLFYTHKFKSVIPWFIYVIFQQINWKLYNEASGVPSLSKSTILSIKSRFPCIEEQTKISNTFSSIDTKIETITTQITKTQTFKKGLLQQMFV